MVQGISQEAIESEAFGMQESIQLASASSSDIFIVQHIEQTAGLDNIMYTAVVDHDDPVFVEGNIPIDVQDLLDVLEDNFYDLPVVPCKISFPRITIKSSSDQRSELPERPQFLNDSKFYNYIVVLVEGQWDFGDDPESYRTLLAEDGARHVIVPGYYLGRKIDAEADGFPGYDAAGDNHNDSDDEDGVAFLSPLVRGAVANVNVTASAPGVLNAWLDFDIDGEWNDTEEEVISNRELSAGDNYLSFEIPESATAGKTYLRFRYSSGEGLRPYGAALDGEVEDYCIDIR